MNNAVKNQNYPKKPQYISLDQIFDIMYEMKVSMSPGLVYPLSYYISIKLRSHSRNCGHIWDSTFIN